MKLLGVILLVITCLLGILRYEDISLWSSGIGLALGSALFLILTSFKPQQPPAPIETNNPWQARFHELDAQSKQSFENLNRESQKLQQKLVRAEERCTSYQKLVDVHQGEIDKLKHENSLLGQQVIEKDRKLAEFQLARIEPDLFDAEKRQTESFYRELKKQFEEKSQALEQSRIRLFKVESALLALQKEKEEQSRNVNPIEANLIDQLKQTEEEKRKLETELVSLQQIVSELSLLKNKPPKKKASMPKISADLLGLDTVDNDPG
jgi:chromosome segregation ATPase